MGYPVITVSSEQTGPSERVLKLSQKKFTADGSEGTPTKSNLVECAAENKIPFLVCCAQQVASLKLFLVHQSLLSA